MTPEALEEKRRRLDDLFWETSNANQRSIISTVNNIQTAVNKPESATNPCRRRLDGTKMSDEERRRLGAKGCLNFQGGTATAFSVSLGRGATKETERSHAIAVNLGDGNAQDVFAVKISQDTVYGTPIFTTMGGSSS